MLAEVFKYVIWATSPLGVWIVGSFLALIGVFGRKRWKYLVLWLATGQLVLLSIEPVSNQLMGSLERQAANLEASRPLPEKVDAIVVLGGGMTSGFEGIRDLPDLNDSADRVWTGALLYRKGVADKVIVSGGVFTDDKRVGPEADAMARLLQDFGVPDAAIVKEMKSRTTLENARLTEQMLAAKVGPRVRVALVTSAFHLPRATALFDQTGMEVFPVRADIRITPEVTPLWQKLPKPTALDRSTMAIKEYLGRLQLYVSNWFGGQA